MKRLKAWYKRTTEFVPQMTTEEARTRIMTAIDKSRQNISMLEGKLTQLNDHDLGNELERQTIEALKAESNLKM